MGTYNTELLSITAAIKTISILEQHNNIEQINNKGKLFIDNINDIFKRLELLNSVEAVAYRWPCMPFIWFKESQNIKKEFYSKLAQKGILLLENHMNFISLSHTKEDIEITTQKIEEAITECLLMN